MNELNEVEITKLMFCGFETGSYGPATFDCYGLLWFVNNEYFGRELPRFDDAEYTLKRINALIEHQALSEDWLLTEDPAPGDAVVMRRAGESYHVGVYIETDDGARVLHATPANGIVCSDYAALARMNFKHLDAYHYANN